MVFNRYRPNTWLALNYRTCLNETTWSAWMAQPSPYSRLFLLCISGFNLKRSEGELAMSGVPSLEGARYLMNYRGIWHFLSLVLSVELSMSGAAPSSYGTFFSDNNKANIKQSNSTILVIKIALFKGSSKGLEWVDSVSNWNHKAHERITKQTKEMWTKS